MASLYEDFLSSVYWQAIGGSVVQGFKVLLFMTILGVLFTFLSGATQAKKWKDSEAN